MTQPNCWFILAAAREADALAATPARARKTTQQLDLETRAQALRSNSSSPRASVQPHPLQALRAWSPPAPSQQGTDLAAVLHRRNDALQREEEPRREQRERDEDRRADRQAAEEGGTDRGTHRAQLAALMVASHPARHGVLEQLRGGSCSCHATSVFTGDGTADCGTYLRTLERLFKAHGIPDSNWPNEQFIKLAGLGTSTRSPTPTRFPLGTR
jgi:hypothetical protein